jgi:broad specificity phosphatase PhoE
VSEIVLCRHAATEHNLANRFLSTTDLPLGPHGLAQCERLRAALAPLRVQRCLVSPMRRCLETRELAAPALPFAIEPALREVDFGSWEGRTLEWAEDHAPEMLAGRRRDPVHFRPPDGESIADVAKRLGPLAERLHGDDAILVIGHRLTLGILERLLRNLPLDSQSIIGLATAEFRIVPA